MSRVLYGRSLPSELVDVIKAAVTVPSVCTTPNNEPSTTSHETEEMAQSSSTQNEVTVRPATAPVDSPPTEPETSKRLPIELTFGAKRAEKRQYLYLLKKFPGIKLSCFFLDFFWLRRIVDLLVN